MPAGRSAVVRVIAIAFATALLFSHCSPIAAPVVEKGVLNLENYDFSARGPVTLSGEWELYWQKLYSSSDISRLSDQQQKKAFITVPSFWNRSDELPSHGYATLRVRIKGDLPQNTWLYHEYSATAYRFICGDRIFASAGDVSRSAEKGRPLLNASLAPLPALMIRDRTLTELESRGRAIGFTEELNLSELEIDIRKGDSFIFNTDGILEVRDSDYRFFNTLEAIREEIKKPGFNIENLSERLLLKARKFSNETRFEDDVTLICIEIPG